MQHMQVRLYDTGIVSNFLLYAMMEIYHDRKPYLCMHNFHLYE